MGSGEVDVNWARQHHSLWLDKQIEKGRVRGGGATAPAE
jgi:formate dehydrogenase subunit gamma